MQQSQRSATSLKRDSKTFSCAYSKMFRDYFLDRTTPVAAFKACFSARKELKEKKVNGEIFFALISLLHVQIQEPCKHVTYYKSICLSCKIYYHKIFETKS